MGKNIEWIYLVIFLLSTFLSFVKYLDNVTWKAAIILCLSIIGAGLTISDLSATSNKLEYIKKLSEINDSLAHNIDSLGKVNHTITQNIQNGLGVIDELTKQINASTETLKNYQTGGNSFPFVYLDDTIGYGNIEWRSIKINVLQKNGKDKYGDDRYLDGTFPLYGVNIEFVDVQTQIERGIAVGTKYSFTTPFYRDIISGKQALGPFHFLDWSKYPTQYYDMYISVKNVSYWEQSCFRLSSSLVFGAYKLTNLNTNKVIYISRESDINAIINSGLPKDQIFIH
jgi:hypothetical protein